MNREGTDTATQNDKQGGNYKESLKAPTSASKSGPDWHPWKCMRREWLSGQNDKN